MFSYPSKTLVDSGRSEKGMAYGRPSDAFKEHGGAAAALQVRRKAPAGGRDRVDDRRVPAQAGGARAAGAAGGGAHRGERSQSLQLFAQRQGPAPASRQPGQVDRRPARAAGRRKERPQGGRKRARQDGASGRQGRRHRSAWRSELGAADFISADRGLESSRSHQLKQSV